MKKVYVLFSVLLLIPLLLGAQTVFDNVTSSRPMSCPNGIANGSRCGYR